MDWYGPQSGATLACHFSLVFPVSNFLISFFDFNHPDFHLLSAAIVGEQCEERFRNGKTNKQPDEFKYEC